MRQGRKRSRTRIENLKAEVRNQKKEKNEKRKKNTNAEDPPNPKSRDRRAGTEKAEDAENLGSISNPVTEKRGIAPKYRAVLSRLKTGPQDGLEK
jgi:hypothetical protein